MILLLALPQYREGTGVKTEKAIMRAHLSNVFHDVRRSCAFSQITMSEKLRISTRAYGNLERGQACCSAQTLIRLLAMMQMPEAYTLIRKLDDAFREQENQEPENAA